MTGSPPRLTPASLWAGALASLAILGGVFVYGIAIGMVANGKGLSLAEATLMSGLVLAGAAQLAALQAWSDPAPVFAACLASFAMNSRLILVGAALRPMFAWLPPAQAYPALFATFDTNFALAAAEERHGRNGTAQFIGGGIAIWFVWTLSTGLGHAFGQLLGDERRLGLDFMVIAFFGAIAVMVWRGKSDLAPILAAVTTAIAFDRLVDGPWYLIAGALAGSLVGALRHDAEA